MNDVKNMTLLVLLLLFVPVLTALILIIIRLTGGVKWGGNVTGGIGIILLLLALYTLIYFIIVIVNLPNNVNPEYRNIGMGIVYMGLWAWPGWVAIVVVGLILLIIGKCSTS